MYMSHMYIYASGNNTCLYIHDLGTSQQTTCRIPLNKIPSCNSSMCGQPEYERSGAGETKKIMPDSESAPSKTPVIDFVGQLGEKHILGGLGGSFLGWGISDRRIRNQHPRKHP